MNLHVSFNLNIISVICLMRTEKKGPYRILNKLFPTTVCYPGAEKTNKKTFSEHQKEKKK